MIGPVAVPETVAVNETLDNGAWPESGLALRDKERVRGVGVGVGGGVGVGVVGVAGGVVGVGVGDGVTGPPEGPS